MSHTEAQNRILLVDDDPSFCYFLAHLAGARGLTLDCIGSVLELEDERPVSHYNAAIVDYNLGQVDGLDTSDAISILFAEDLPVVLISAYDPAEMPTKSWPPSIKGFVAKSQGPFAILDLAEALAREHVPPPSLLPPKLHAPRSAAELLGERHWTGM